MPIRVALHHKTSYHYDRFVEIFPQVVRLKPAPHCRTPIRSYSLRVTPGEHFLNWQQDPHGNYLGRLVFPKKSDRLEFDVELVADMVVVNPFDFFLEAYAEQWPFTYDEALKHDLAPFLPALPAGPLVSDFVAQVPRDTKRTVDFLVDLNSRVNRAISYTIRMEPGVKTPEQSLTDRSGSCRDSAWLMVDVLRHLGLAARFVSGYLIQLVPDIKALDGPVGASADFTDLHAWTEVYLPGAGWVGLDPTSGLFAGEGHIPLAATPEPSTAAPVSGSVEPCEATFHTEMSVERVHEDPRVTKPYTDEEWQEINALGHRIDAQLEAGSVRLTMGGEPTFVSIDDYEGDEWNTTAMGPNKRRLSGQLVRRLHTSFAPGGLLHFGQGKWYPGEQLPRWSLSCYWRKDGEPIWRDMNLVAHDELSMGHGPREARAFIERLSHRLGVGDDHIITGYEDAWYHLWRERRLPTNVDPFDSKLDDEVERRRLARIFEQGLSAEVGYVLPIRRGVMSRHSKWESGPWFFRPERMYLIPGDSPMGLRLPLDSLPWLAPGDRPQQFPLDPHAPRGPLPPYGVWEHSPNQNGEAHDNGASFDSNGSSPAMSHPLSHHSTSDGNRGPGQLTVGRSGGEGSPSALMEHVEPQQLEAQRLTGPRFERDMPQSTKVRTALCVEPRNGRLHVFMPPVELAEDYLELVAAIEGTAADLQMPVHIEGYLPPHDHRLAHLRVTPDPGVIEVNVHPAQSWDSLVQITTTLYDDARHCRLGTEKFMIDGRHTGTGGGNHVVLGGATPSDSPFLRRPDLVRSLVAFWNNHPSLSYLLSGLFVGPTSQAPRTDEARHESLYELEIAFQQLPQNGGRTPPWIVDRLFRNLLVDLTGNTHRAEFCIDKLFSPDHAAGRLGLVEFRAFEMPPHAQMSLAQQLLIRSLVARFWNKPYTREMVRWGTALHDRFMLPHFISQDFTDVIRELNDEGIEMKKEWFAAHFEFRFPVYGRVVYDNVEVELRQAIEPWHVLGEESMGGSTARAVDSSLERLQVKVRGMTETRHALFCNGRHVPLFPTGTVGEFVAGVRYRAWQPPSCLHPTIGVHAPLAFDLLDEWTNHVMGGCTWNVSHPGGRSYDTRPVNAFEAESRRAAQFVPVGSAGGVEFGPVERSGEYPMTLDLRRAVEPVSLGER
jgi:uncharacterized protein (DUF2126 family)/transglutaminase-like putative cysteine protease